jgi:hypothetical protein
MPNQFKFVRQEDLRKADHLAICASCSEALDARLLEQPYKPIEDKPDGLGSLQLVLEKKSPTSPIWDVVASSKSHNV